MASNNNYTVEQLNDDQRNAYNEIRECLSLEESKVILIDSPSGTGKTFMLTVLAETYRNTDNRVQFLTLTNDQVKVWKARNIQASTYYFYFMSNLQLSFEEVTELKNMDAGAYTNISCKLSDYARRYMSDSSKPNIIIMDPYTVMSPIWILLLHILAFKNKIKLIFVGDKMQPGAMITFNNRFDDTNNFCLVKKRSDLTIDYLAINRRSSDHEFLNKLADFRRSLEPYSRTGDAEFRFNLRYLLYGLFRSKYFTKERFDTVYMAQFNHDLTRRLYRFKDHLDSTGTQYVIEPFYKRGNQGLVPITIPLDENAEYFPGLLLLEGCDYIYTTESDENKFVCLEKIVYNQDNQVDFLRVQPISNELPHQVEIRRRNLYSQLPWKYKNWLLNMVGTNVTELWEFPLRLHTLTYHAALGRTVDKDVELCTRRNFNWLIKISANRIYTGLCCVTHESAIHKIHDDQNLSSFLVTEYMETKPNGNEFYYRYSSDVSCQKNWQAALSPDEKNFIDNIKWKDASSIEDFEKETSSDFLRIRRSLYGPPEY